MLQDVVSYFVQRDSCVWDSEPEGMLCAAQELSSLPVQAVVWRVLAD